MKLFVDKTYNDPLLKEFCDFLDIPYEDDTIKIEIFQDKTFKDNRLRNKEKNGRSFGGKISSPKKNVSIIHSETNEVMKFSSKGECMKFLKISPRTFSKLVKGQTVRGCKWSIL